MKQSTAPFRRVVQPVAHRHPPEHEDDSCCYEIKSLSLAPWLWHKLFHINELIT